MYVCMNVCTYSDGVGAEGEGKRESQAELFTELGAQRGAQSHDTRSWPESISRLGHSTD